MNAALKVQKVKKIDNERLKSAILMLIVIDVVFTFNTFSYDLLIILQSS